jgi:hypothetical protein
MVIAQVTTMTKRSFIIPVLVLAIASACGGSSPTSPGETGAGASISGSVQGASSAMTSAVTGGAVSGLVVTVAGTSISSGLDAAGRFNLQNVPAGNQQLEFSGPVSATLPIDDVKPSESISLVLSMTSSGVNLESQVRSNGREEQLEGKIDSLSPALTVAGRTVTTDTNTVIRKGNASATLSDLQVGYRVHVKGNTSGSSLLATQIIIQNTNTDTSDDADDDDQDSSASIHGKLNSIGGSAPTLTLDVGGTTVRTSSGTVVKRRGDVQTLAELKVGQDLHVIGTRQSDGSIDARHIEINDDATGGEVQIQGSAGGVSGSCPTLSFNVNGYKITTNGSTVYDGFTCADMKSGTKVTVTGTSQADNSVLATNVKKG